MWFGTSDIWQWTLFKTYDNIDGVWGEWHVTIDTKHNRQFSNISNNEYILTIIICLYISNQLIATCVRK